MRLSFPCASTASDKHRMRRPGYKANHLPQNSLSEIPSQMPGCQPRGMAHARAPRSTRSHRKLSTCMCIHVHVYGQLTRLSSRASLWLLDPLAFHSMSHSPSSPRGTPAWGTPSGAARVQVATDLRTPPYLSTRGQPLSSEIMPHPFQKGVSGLFI